MVKHVVGVETAQAHLFTFQLLTSLVEISFCCLPLKLRCILVQTNCQLDLDAAQFELQLGDVVKHQTLTLLEYGLPLRHQGLVQVRKSSGVLHLEVVKGKFTQ